MINIDLSKFKKLEDSDKHAILQHENGHKMTIAKNAISDRLRKQLDELPTSLAKGGYAKFSQKFDPNMASKASKSSKASNTMPAMQPREATKTYTEPDEQGGNDIVLKSLNRQAPPYGVMGAEQQHYPPCVNPSCKSFGKPHPNCKCYGGNPEGKESHIFADGGEVEKEYYCDSTRAHRKGCEYFKDGGNVESASDKLEQAKQEVNAESPSMASAPLMNEVNSSPAPEAMSPLNPNPEMAQEPEVAAAPAQDMPAETPQVSKPETPINQVMQHKDRVMKEIYPEAQAFQSDLDNGHITPETYSDLFHKKDTLGKIGTLFGLLIGGAGAGLTHQSNPIMEMMNKQIQNDLEAQQHSVTNKQNFLKINQQNILNKAQAGLTQSEANTKAYALTRMQMNYAAFHKLVSDTQKLPPGPQRQQAETTLAMMKQGIDNENFSIADRAASASALGNIISGNSGTGPNTTLMKSGLVGPEAKEVGEDLEQKTIPGIPGRAQRPIPQQTRDQVQNMNVLDSKAKDLIDYAKKHEGSWNPQTRAIAQQKANEMVGFYSSSLGTSMTEGTRNWLDDQIAKKNPVSVIAQELMGSNARLKEIQNSNNMRRNTLLGSVGLKGPDQGLMSKSGKEIIYKNGKAYYK